MARPQLYINVSQTMAIGLAATAFVSYIFDIRGFRTDLNRILLSGRR